jgi:hypothetical protein
MAVMELSILNTGGINAVSTMLGFAVMIAAGDLARRRRVGSNSMEAMNRVLSFSARRLGRIR